MAKAASRMRRLRNELAHTEDLFHWSAQCNIAHNEGLFDALLEALTHAGVPREEVAERLGIDLDTLADALSGQTDLTLTELRMLSSASEVIIKFEVESALVERARMAQRDLIELAHAYYVVEEQESSSRGWADTATLFRAIEAKAVVA
ncbi:hypothetical protein LVJ59_15140 [Microbacterium sp. KKR3/1]|uniref:helix-turn-helix domain-containing protein n=1 Tax=Microbacterium sp. KKR3/1 TaxID=2904241 RepID=UPI001E4AE5A5|nr:hypothetical protein [Microbacterium sp. KKR3/1]MCE0510383.1 hypothetical protein [Microbacterium sp. KKR3/1]